MQKEMMELYSPLIKKLERYSKKHPGAYKFKLYVLSLFGYFYILMVLVGSIILLSYSFSLINTGERLYLRLARYLIIFSVIILAVILKTLLLMIFLKFPKPQGIVVKPKQLPRLCRMIDEIGSQLKSLKLNRVLITGDYNAYISQIPTLGILGGYENYLVIGLPLMYALSDVELKAVLAHEFGHISKNHSAFGGWIYRCRMTWQHLIVQLEQQDGFYALFAWLLFLFFYWYIPSFEAYSFVLARQDEYEADNSAGKLVGKEKMASALLNVTIQGYHLEQTWKDIERKLNNPHQTPPHVVNELITALNNPLEPDEIQKHIGRALMEKTDLSDTHPCLKERLRALGVTLDKLDSLLIPKTKTAAETYIGDKIEILIDKVNQQWYKENMA